MRLTRIGLVLFVTAMLVAAPAAPAVGVPAVWSQDGLGKVACQQVPTAACDLFAQTTGQGSGGERQPVSDRAGDDATYDQAGEADVAHRITCGYVPVDYVPPEAVVAPGPMSAVDAPGGWYMYQCGDDPVFWGPVWLPEEEAPDGTAGPSVADVAQQAYGQLRLTQPRIGVSPVADQLVHLPTWLWLDGWGAVSATASVPGVAVTATATPESVSWSMGDGGTVNCDSPGVRFTAEHDPAAESPSCGYTYGSSSAGQPGGVFEVTAIVEWTVSWSSAGQSGVFPGLTTSAATQLRVVESPALNTRGRTGR